MIFNKLIFNKINYSKLQNYIKKKNNIKNFNYNKVYHIHNSFHLGDNVFNFIAFKIIYNYIEKNNITIFYYAKEEYLNQLNEFFNFKNIILLSLKEKPSNSIELWINNEFFCYRHDLQKMPLNYNKYLKNFFNIVFIKLYFNIKINYFYYEDKTLLEYYHNLDNKFKNLDILIINSEPQSNQYNYNKLEWDNYITKLNNLFNIATTTKVNNILCTSDYNLTIKYIAALSIKCKIVIAINSGVLPGLLNIYTLLNVKTFYIFDKNNYYSYPNFKSKNNINDISIEELKGLIYTS